MSATEVSEIKSAIKASQDEIIKRVQANGIETRNMRSDLKNWATTNKAQIITAIQRAQAAGGTAQKIADAVVDAIGDDK